MPIADPTETPALPQALAETYGDVNEVDPWTRVKQYRDVRDYTASHPNKGSQAVATALELPRSRVRAWVESGSRPDPARAIDVADTNGWLDHEWDDDSLAALNVLVAEVFAAGSIGATNYRPAFTGDRDVLEATCAHLGIEFAERHADADSRATEFIPTTNASVLGRLLSVLGAPVGPKHDRKQTSLPAYLKHEKCPARLRVDFAQVVVTERGTPRPDRSATPVQIREERPTAYHEALRGLLADVVGDRDAIRGGDTATTYLSARAAAVLDVPPSTTR